MERTRVEDAGRWLWRGAKSLWRRTATRAAQRRFWRLGLYVGLFAASLPLVEYVRQDVTVTFWWEVVPVGLVFAGLGLLVLAVFSAWLGSSGERLAAAVLTSYVLLAKFDWLLDKTRLSRPLGTVPASLAITVAVLLAAGYLVRLLRRLDLALERHQAAVNALFGVAATAVVVVVALNALAFSKYLYAHRAASSYRPHNNVTTSGLRPPANPPDIYYFVFDRYMNARDLNQIFKYDNADFINWLHGKGFVTRDDAVSNYQYTAPSIASTMRMDYLTDIGTDLSPAEPANYLPYKRLIDQSPTAELLHGAGYDLYTVGNWWNVTHTQKHAANLLPEFEVTLFNRHQPVSELQSKVFRHTFASPLLKTGLRIAGFTLLRVTDTDHHQLYLDQLSLTHGLARSPHDKPRFVFAHFLNAHPPYTFRPDGSEETVLTGDDDRGAPRRQKYVRQLQYANRSAEDLITDILSHATTPPVIIIQADEGPYPLDYRQNGWDKADATTVRTKFSTLAAYYLPGTTAQQAAAANSSVNVFRFVFNRYFNRQLPYLPDCSYLFNKDRPFQFFDITATLHPADARCKEYATKR